MSLSRIKILIVLILVLASFSGISHYIAINHIYTNQRILLTYGNIFSSAEISEILTDKNDRFFITYITSFLSFLGLVIIVSIFLYASLILLTKETDFILVAILTCFSSLIFFIPQYFTLYYYLCKVKIFTISSYERFYPLSLASIDFFESGSILTYVLYKQINMFHIFFIILVSVGLRLFLGVTLQLGFRVAILGYSSFLILYFSFIILANL